MNMTMDEIVDRVSAWEGVLTLRPGPGDGSPEISWGDAFFYVAPDGKVPAGQPFATITTKDYPGEPDAGLDRSGSFRVNIADGGRGRPGGASASAAVGDKAAPDTPDVVLPHPAYADLGWVAVVNPGERTRQQVLALLLTAHQAAMARWRRRHGDDHPSDRRTP
jgi:hypothetical protein